MQERYPVRVDPDMPPPLPCGHILFAIGKGITVPWHRRPGKIQRPARIIENRLHHIGIKQVFRAFNGFAQRCHLAVRIRRQIARYLIDHRRRNQWLVTLHIDDNVIVSQRQFCGHFLKTIRPGGVIITGHDHRHGVTQHIGNAGIVSGHIDLISTTLLAAFSYPLHHGFTGNVSQRLARQTGRRIPRRHHYVKTHSLPRKKSGPKLKV